MHQTDRRMHYKVRFFVHHDHYNQRTYAKDSTKLSNRQIYIPEWFFNVGKRYQGSLVTLWVNLIDAIFYPFLWNYVKIK